MTAQTAILEPAPHYARHLFFDLKRSAHPGAELHALAAACDGQISVMGMGKEAARALIDSSFARLVTGGYCGYPSMPGLPNDLSALE